MTLFRGTNDDERAREAHAAWLDAGRTDAELRASREVQVRQALVHEFRARSKVLVCTEAGAKGLNLQFCETVVNYDLPWNPQRIEQRIGRCHRYGQERAVTVVNFLAKDNAAHRLTFEILSQKLELFGRVLDASDQVLHQPRSDASAEALTSIVAGEIESELGRIHQRARTALDLQRDLVERRVRVEDRRRAWEAQQRHTAALIESRFDDEVKVVFRGLRDQLRAGLDRLDRELATLVGGHLVRARTPHVRRERDGRVVFELEDRAYATGSAKGLVGAEALGLAHPLVAEAVASARTFSEGSVLLTGAPEHRELVGKEGALTVAKVAYDGFEPVERLVVAAVVGGVPLDPEVAATLVRLPATDAPDLGAPVDDRLLADALEEALWVDQRAIEGAEQARFERALLQLERFVEDRAMIGRRERQACAEALAAARRRRDEALGADARTRAEGEIRRLEARIGELDERVGALEARQDQEYQTWRQKHHDRRYARPTVTPLYRATFRIRSAPC